MKPGGLSRRQDELRYLRRRSNRRVRKARRVRTTARWSLILLSQLGLATVLVVAGMSGFQQVADSPRFGLQQIRIEGTQRSSADGIRAQLAELAGESLLKLDLGRIAALALADPWVREASVRRELPHTVVLRIHEREPATRARIAGQLHLVDGEGFVISRCDAGADPEGELPLLVGLDGLRDDELARALARGVDAIGRLRAVSAEWAAGIDELDLQREDRLVVRRGTGRPEIFLDPGQVDRNVRDYLELNGVIGRRVGSVAYVDLRWRERIVVSPHPSTNRERDS